MVGGLGQCAVHPTVAAVEICERCGSFACGECVQFTNTSPSQTLCAACYGRYGGKASTRATVALVLGIVGISSCWLLGVPGFILAVQELAAIERGESPERGRNLAQGAWYLGLIQFGLIALGLVIFVFVTLSRM
jgi:hypothetical protein